MPLTLEKLHDGKPSFVNSSGIHTSYCAICKQANISNA